MAQWYNRTCQLYELSRQDCKSPRGLDKRQNTQKYTWKCRLRSIKDLKSSSNTIKMWFCTTFTINVAQTCQSVAKGFQRWTVRKGTGQQI